MATNISLPDELEAQIRRRVESGGYSSPAEVVREAMRVLEAAETLEAAKLQALRADLRVALDDVRNGRVADLDFDEIRRKGRAQLASDRTP